MALSGTITGTCDNANYTLTCEWSATQSVANNTSSITAKVYLKAPSGWSTVSSNWSCIINGTTVTSGSSKTVGSTKVLLGQRTWTVNHASDGTCSVTISFSYSNGLSSAGTYTTKKGSGSKSVTLNQIARTSSFTLSSSSLDMGSSQTVSITRASSSFTHTVQYTFGGTTTTSHTKTTSTSVSFTPALSLANKIPNATSGTCTVKVTTYSGDTAIGSSSKTFTLKVPSSVKPTVTLATTYNNTLSGLSIAGKSTVKVTPTGTGSYSSTISSYTYSGAGLSGTGSSKTTGTLSAGSYTITVTVKDSRGRTNTATTSFTMYAYSNPWVTASAYRCNSDGTANASGTYAKIKASWGISNPNSANANLKQYKIEWKKSTTTTWSTYKDWTNLSTYSASNTVIDCGSGWVNTTSYDVRLSVKDSYSTATSSSKITTISCIFNVEQGGVGVGKIYERGALDVGGHVYATTYTGSGNGKNLVMGTGANDVYIHNSASGKYLQLKDNGTLSYSDTPIVTGTMSSSGNRWGVVTNIDTNGIMEVGKYIDFHDSDSDTSDYSARLYHYKDGWLSTQKFDVSHWEFAPLRITRNDGSTNGAAICFANGNGTLGYIGMYGSVDSGLYRYSADTKSSYRILDSNGTQTITGSLHTGSYVNTYQGLTMRRYTEGIGNYMGKIGCSNIGGTDKTVTIEVGSISNTSTDAYSVDRRYSFGMNYFLTHTDNTVNIGSSNYRFKAVYATNGTIQTSDGRYKFILEDLDNQTCYDLIKDMNLYGYSTLNKRIDEYASTTEISDELQQSSQEDMNLHMGFIAQEIEDSELAKYILIKDELENGDHIYGIDNYGYTTAVHGALQHEIELRDAQIEEKDKQIEELQDKVNELQSKNEELEERLARIETLLNTNA